MIGVAGGVPVPVPLREKNNSSMDLEALGRLISERTRLTILSSPSNPTGGVIPIEDLEQIAAAAQQHDCWVMSDEIYAQIVYDGVEASTGPQEMVAQLVAELHRRRDVIVEGLNSLAGCAARTPRGHSMPFRASQRAARHPPR